VRAAKGERVFDVFNSLFMVLFIALVLLPLASVVATSLVSAQELAQKRFVVVPAKIDFTAYHTIFENGSIIIDAYLVTIFRVVVGTVANMVVTYFLAYGLSIRRLPGRKGITVFIFITMLFSGGLIPYYVLVGSLGLMNSLWVYILPVLVSAWNTLLLRNFIMGIPESLFETAEIDGASELVIIFRVVLPLSMPAMATIGLFYAVGHWNSWWDAYLFVRDSRKQPIQLVLRNILSVSMVSINRRGGGLQGRQIAAPPRAIQNAVIVVSTLPVIFLYPFAQRYFVRGIIVGSIKG